MSVPEPDPRPLLLCVDGSAASRASASRGAELLAAPSAIAVSAWLPAPTFRHGPLADTAEALLEPAVEVDAASERAARAAAQEVADDLRAQGKACVAEPVCVGRSTWRTLLDVAADRDAAAVVAGAHGTSGSETNVIGSVAMAIVHHARLPVLVVPAGAQGTGPVVLGFDGSPGAEHAARIAGRLLRSRPALAVCVFGPTGPLDAVLGASAGGWGGAGHRTRDEAAAERAAGIATAGANLSWAAGLPATPEAFRAEHGAREALERLARERHAAAIVVGSRGHGALGRAVLGSVSSGVASHPPVPVLVVPPPPDRASPASR